MGLCAPVDTRADHPQAQLCTQVLLTLRDFTCYGYLFSYCKCTLAFTACLIFLLISILNKLIGEKL